MEERESNGVGKKSNLSLQLMGGHQISPPKIVLFFAGAIDLSLTMALHLAFIQSHNYYQ